MPLCGLRHAADHVEGIQDKDAQRLARHVANQLTLAEQLAGDGTRTRDHLLGRQALYQLSYSRAGLYSNSP